MNSPQQIPTKVFISYSHKDKEWLEEFKTHLVPLMGVVYPWDDTKITAGTKWKDAITNAITSADIGILLVTPDFLASPFITENELPPLLKGKRVFWIAVRNSSYEMTPIAEYQAANDPSRPLSSFPKGKRDGEWVNICKKLKAVIENPSITFSNQDSTSSGKLWNVPYQRNPFFTGRTEILAQLHDALVACEPPALAQPQVISGLGGMGKTQTAVEYAYRHRNDYRCVLWIRAETENELREGFVEIARMLGLKEAEEADQSRAVEAAKIWLSNNGSWLLILDNADDLNITRPYIPVQTQGHILLTTRASATGAIAQPVRIAKLPEREAALLLLRRSRLIGHNEEFQGLADEDWLSACTIAHHVDALPLALDQVGAFIEETQETPTEYLQLYLEKGATLLTGHSHLGGYEHAPVTVTFTLAFDKVAHASSAAADLIRCCAFLAPDVIPEEIFTSGSKWLGPNLGLTIADPLHWRQVIKEACRYSLLTRDPITKTLSIHRLVQAVLLNSMEEETRQLWAERIVRATNEAFPYVEHSTWPVCERILPHALSCADIINKMSVGFGAATRLLNQAAHYLRERGQYALAEPLSTQVLELCEKILGPVHLDVAMSLNNLAGLYYEQGRYAEAEPLYQKAIAIIEQSVTPNNLHSIIQFLISVTENLLGLYYVQGLYTQVERLLSRSLAIKEQMFGIEHPEVALSLNNLAETYRELGQYGDAESLHKRALAIREKIFGPEHPEVATSLNNLGGLLQDQGNFAASESVYKRALAIREKIFGPEHPEVATSLNNLAVLYYAEGRYAEAEPLLSRSLAIRKRIFGPEHQEIALVQESYDMVVRQLHKGV